MKYIIHVIPINRNFISWFESELQYCQDGLGMANGRGTSKFFSTEKLAVSDTRRQLRKARVREEDILID